MHHSAFRYALIAAATAFSCLGQSSGTILGAGYVSPTLLQVAPGQIITVYAAGVGSSLTRPVLAGPGALPTLLAGIGVTIRQGSDIPAPILEVSPVSTCGAGCGVVTAITIQVPYGLFTGCGGLCNALRPDVAILTELFVTENGVAGTVSPLNAVPDQVHILTMCDSVLTAGTGSVPLDGLPCQPMVTHANGALVSNMNPAVAGEELVAWAVGLGATNPAVPAGQPAAQPTPTVETFTLDFNYHPNALGSRPTSLATAGTAPLVPLFAGLTAEYPGLYQINFVVPSLQQGELPCAYGVTPPPGGLPATNLTVSVDGVASFDGAGICVSLAE